MNRKLTLLLVTAAMMSVCVLAAQADDNTTGKTATPRVDRREARQQHRIAQGVKSGQLTPRETARLEHGQARVERAEGRAKADGKVTPAERRHLAHMQNRQSRHIYRAKHNARTDQTAHTDNK